MASAVVGVELVRLAQVIEHARQLGGLGGGGVLVVCDRLAGGAAAIVRAAGAPYRALTTIDEVYPERPDR